MAQAIETFISRDTGLEPTEAPSDEDMSLIITQIRQICRDSSLEFALRVAAVVIHNFYGGEIEAWRARGPKTHSFRRLAEHPDLPMSPAALYRCVAVFELCHRLNAPTRWRRLGASHFRTVLGLEPSEQEELLVAANQKHWTVQQLQSAALERRSGDSRRGGRKPKSTLVKSLSSIQRSLRGCECELALEKELDSLGPNEIEESVALLAEARAWVESLARVLARRGHAAL